MTSYEDVLVQITSVPAASSSGLRDIAWLTSAEVVGVARDSAGRLEVFLAGPELQPALATVKEALEHHTWHRASGSSLEANRLLLPALGHFDHVAAFISTELLRNGAEDNLVDAFRATEPLIELAIERLLLSEYALLGLVGELLLLNAMCNQVDDYLVASVVQSWDGWRRSVRDFHWEGTGVEIKTTMRATSSHQVQGVHQIEPDDGENDDPAENRLLLVSVGLQYGDPSANSVSIPGLVQRIIERLAAAGSATHVPELLSRISKYGAESAFGYDHASMQDDAPFTTEFTIAFVRAYDMADPLIEVLRSDVVAAHQHVDKRSLRFRINLPATVTAQNPVAGANQAARWILGD